ncbi:hypothetical protein MGG_15929 [Pyricularia oryzae 70-15]|uniref:Uncharacterized protein n=3 Tax=Pyricularia oryzae TaxID=318829 RepID=G4MWB4_PYRO7|nr:uncharacterized protein MGG_15929 [Pyricularia oryzae 70-15]EHA55874.1 hypothetical protein MGG_15929 [Pyricularia oryzae 70-15]ELQ43741.1 hypothetical protein OOU_Y34scaffold00138g20 [Pyricularia oryzae Y34]
MDTFSSTNNVCRYIGVYSQFQIFLFNFVPQIMVQLMAVATVSTFLIFQADK